MITAFIVLLVIALALGCYIAFDILCGKKKAAAADSESTSDAEKLVEKEIYDTPDKDGMPSTTDAEDAADGQSDDVEIQQIKPVEEKDGSPYIVFKYSKSFLAKLIQSDETTKRYYSEIKNRLLAYSGVKSRINWKGESFRSGKQTLAKLRLRGKTISLCLALNADDYVETKYNVESLDMKSFADTPCMYRIKNDRRLRYSADLIAQLMQKHGIAEKRTASYQDYAALYPYEDADALINCKLIKVLTEGQAQSGTKFKPAVILPSVTVQEADALIKDEVAATFVEKSCGTSDRTKIGIVNIDTLSQYFNIGETVTLKEVIKRIPSVSLKTTYLKVLARGTLNKPLTVEADSFSLQAVKMIVLTGGKAVKRQ